MKSTDQWKPLDYIAGEAAFEAYGANESKLFENAAMGLFETMADTQQLKSKQKLEIQLSDPEIDILLHNFLSEIVAQKDTTGLLFSKTSITVKKIKNVFHLKAEVFGQSAEAVPFNVIRSDVKAVTFHDFRVERKGKALKATVVLDI